MKPGVGSRVPDAEYVEEILPEHLPKDRLGIAVFGPGEGEAIVVRLPDGSIGVVDGCREPKVRDKLGRGDPVRELLNRLAAEPDVPRPLTLSFVCLTHPHDDHYAGLGRLLEAYEGRVARVWNVTHATGRYANSLLKLIRLTRGGKISVPDGTRLKGLERVVERLRAARERSDVELTHLAAGIQLLRTEHHGIPVTATSCGPASLDMARATDDLHAALNALERNDQRVGSHDPNLTSGALLLRWGTSAVLLAGDLLTGVDHRSGWRYGQKHIQGEVQVVNVAHHASKEAHHDDLWTTMRPALAIVTPFQHAKMKQPPRPDQIAALSGSSVVAITSPPDWKGETRPPCSIRGTVVKGSPLRNAVAVSLDAAGNITRFVLAGAADVYEPARAAV